MATADAVVVTLPLTESTRGLVGAQALSAMRADAVLINVGRGPVIDEQALFDALQQRRIAGAVIDTWYQYPGHAQAQCAPSRLDFAGLDNLVMTPHMSGWTEGTVRRRQQTLADNITRLAQGQPLINVLRPAQT
jgi:phosphoglycerate dehydrogenase-like enzyme